MHHSEDGGTAVRIVKKASDNLLKKLSMTWAQKKAFLRDFVSQRHTTEGAWDTRLFLFRHSPVSKRLLLTRSRFARLSAIVALGWNYRQDLSADCIVYGKIVWQGTTNTNSRVANDLPWRANSLTTSPGDFDDDLFPYEEQKSVERFFGWLKKKAVCALGSCTQNKSLCLLLLGSYNGCCDPQSVGLPHFFLSILWHKYQSQLVKV